MPADNKNLVLPDNEKALFHLVAGGDEKAFETLFNLFLPRLYPFIIKFTKSEPAAQEIIQETFIRVWLNRDKLEEIENPGGWLFKVASNECYNYIRNTALYDERVKAISPQPISINAPQDWLDLKELKRLVAEAVDKLPLQRKKIYRMSRDEGKSIPEIAEALGISPNTVKNTLVTSLRFVREELARAGVSMAMFILFYWKK